MPRLSAWATGTVLITSAQIPKRQSATIPRLQNDSTPSRPLVSSSSRYRQATWNALSLPSRGPQLFPNSNLICRTTAASVSFLWTVQRVWTQFRNTEQAQVCPRFHLIQLCRFRCKVPPNNHLMYCLEALLALSQQAELYLRNLSFYCPCTASCALIHLKENSV